MKNLNGRVAVITGAASGMGAAMAWRFARSGMKIVHVGEVMGRKRQLVALDLERPWIFDEANMRLVAGGDFEQQSALTAAGWRGFTIVPSGARTSRQR